MSITAWNGVAIIISEPESCRQRHCNKRKKVRRSVARSSRPSDGLALCFLQGRRRTRVTPILHRIIEELGPRAREVVMSAALVFTDRVCSFLTKDRRRVFIGRRHTTNFSRPVSHLAILCRNESEILGDRKFLTNLERICRGRNQDG